MGRFQRLGNILAGVGIGTGPALVTYGSLELLFDWPIVNEAVGVAMWLGMIRFVAKEN